VIRGAWETKMEMDGWMGGRMVEWMEGWGYVGLRLRTYRNSPEVQNFGV